MKPGPVVAMVALIFVGMWLVLQPTFERNERIDPAARRFEMTLGARQFAVEQRSRDDNPDSSDISYEYHTKGLPAADGLGWIDSVRFEAVVAQELQAWESRPRIERTLLGFFNISSWLNFGWIAVGLLGQCAFFGRMLVQWIVSEKKRESVVPAAFWWMSLIGGIFLFSYFVWRVDFIGVLGQSTGVVIYARNIRLIHKQKRRLARLETHASAPERREHSG